jgi:beta-galactosidase/beta-glucuronidase
VKYEGGVMFGRKVLIPADWVGKRIFNPLEDWSEHHPILHLLKVGLKTEYGEDIRKEYVGTFEVRDKKFIINGHKTFLRGTHDRCVFPLTGYVPMDVENWEKVFEKAKKYGLNHYRFHSWCPPRAAFVAADRCGIYLQPELPYWSVNAFADDNE